MTNLTSCGHWIPGEGVQDLPHCQGPGGYNQQWGGEGRQTLEHFASARQGGRGQEQEGGTGEEGGQEGVQAWGVIRSFERLIWSKNRRLLVFLGICLNTINQLDY